MRGEQRRALILLFLALFSLEAFAQTTDLAFSRNARTFETQQGTLVTKSMAFACLSLSVVPDGLPCNPAFTAFNPKPSFQIEAMMSNGYSTLETMRQLLGGTVSQDLVNALFSGNHVLQIEGNGELDFQSPHFNARYTPATVKYFSVVRNEANPIVDLYAVQEDNFSVQSGFEVLPNLYAGVQVRMAERKFVRKQFQLLDLATDAGKDELKPNSQRGVYIEPGVAYIADVAWHPRISAMAVNLGSQTGDFVDLREPAEGQYSLGISPDLPWGKLDLEVDYRSMTYEEQSPEERVHFGMLYHLGVMYLGGGVDNNGVSGSLYFSLESLNAGILYSTTRVPWQSSDFYAQTVYVEAGWRL